jgi:SAM-dependent methyltransferase
MNVNKDTMNSPSDDADAVVLANEVGAEIASRLEWMTIKPATILYQGAKNADLPMLLQQRYPEAQLLTPDEAMPDHSVDMIIANLYLPWQRDFDHAINEWKRLLRVDGLLMFTVFGPDTLKVWRDVFAEHTIPGLIDMHDMGDMLVQMGFADPVLDAAYFTMTYSERNKFIHELKISGMLDKQFRLEENDHADKPLQAEFEVIFAHAFGRAEKIKTEPGISKVPLSMLRDSLKS